jgi:hypothetical protein
MATVLSDKAEALQTRVLYSAPVPSAVASDNYDAERIQQMIAPKKPQVARAPGAWWG